MRFWKHLISAMNPYTYCKVCRLCFPIVRNSIDSLPALSNNLRATLSKIITSHLFTLHQSWEYMRYQAANAQLHLYPIHWISSQVLFFSVAANAKSNDIYQGPYSIYTLECAIVTCQQRGCATMSYPQRVFQDLWLFAIQSSTTAASDYLRYEMS